MSPAFPRDENRKHSPIVRMLFLCTTLVLLATLLASFQMIRRPAGEYESVLFWVLFLAAGFVLSVLLAGIDWRPQHRNRNAVLILVVSSVAFLATLQIYPQANESPVVGWDSYYDVRIATDLANSGHISEPIYPNSSVHRLETSYPGLHFLVASSSIATNTSVMDLSRYFPTIVSVSALWLFWGLVRRLHSSSDAIPLGLFALVFLFGSFEFHSWMVKESLGFPLFLLSLYCCVSYLRLGRATWGVAFIASFAAATVTHHLSSFIILMILATMVLVRMFTRVREKNGVGLTNRRRVVAALLCSIAVWVAYAFVVGGPLTTMFNDLLRSIISPSLVRSGWQGTRVVYDLRLSLLTILTAAVGVFLFAVVISNLRTKRSLTPDWDRAMLGWAASLFAIVVVFSRVFRSSFMPNYGRFLTFPWTFLLQSGLEDFAKRRRARIIVVACMVFCLFNLLSVDTYIYSSSSNINGQYVLNSQGSFDVLTEYPLSGTVLCDSSTAQIAGGWLMLDVRPLPLTTIELQRQYGNFDYVILRDSRIEPPDSYSYFGFSLPQIAPILQNGVDYDRVMDSGSIVIFISGP